MTKGQFLNYCRHATSAKQVDWVSDEGIECPHMSRDPVTGDVVITDRAHLYRLEWDDIEGPTLKEAPRQWSPEVLAFGMEAIYRFEEKTGFSFFEDMGLEVLLS